MALFVVSFLFVVGTLLSSIHLAAASLSPGDISCGTAANFTIGGSSTVQPLATVWASSFQLACPGTRILVEGGGSSRGAARVCGLPIEAGEDEDYGVGPVEIGSMSREWRPGEGQARLFTRTIYDCQPVPAISTTTTVSASLLQQEDGGTTSPTTTTTTTTLRLRPRRSAIQVAVAFDGVTVATLTGGTAANCLQLLGGGLTIDQLRWIFTSYSDSQLLAGGGWNGPEAVPFSDGDEATHLWSELHDECEATEILIAGADSYSGTFEFFSDNIFRDANSGETFDSDRPIPYFFSEDDEVVVNYLQENPATVAYFGFAYFFSQQHILTAASIENTQQQLVYPNTETIADGSYHPLSRPIYMNFLNDAEVLATTYYFLLYGFSSAGAADVASIGYVVVPEHIRKDALNVVRRAGGIPAPKSRVGAVCLPGSTPIRMADGTTQRLDQIQVGDLVAAPRSSVRTSSSSSEHEDEVSKVIYLPHLANRDIVEYVELQCVVVGDEDSNLRTLRATAGHYVFVLQGEDQDAVAVSADMVEVGDLLWSTSDDFGNHYNKQPCVVVSREMAMDTSGYYTAFTTTGTLVVGNGLVVSSYGSLAHIRSDAEPNGYFFSAENWQGHDASHQAASILRWVYDMGWAETSTVRYLVDTAGAAALFLLNGLT